MVVVVVVVMVIVRSVRTPMWMVLIFVWESEEVRVVAQAVRELIAKIFVLVRGR